MKHPSKSTKLCRAALRAILTGLGCLALTSQAAIVTWDGGGGDGLWDTVSNWDGNGTGPSGVPGANDVAVIDTAVTVTKETAFANLTTVNLSNGSSLMYTAGGAYKDLGNVTINVGATSTLLGSQTYRTQNSTLNFDDGALATSLNMLYRNGGGNLGFNLGASGFTAITAGSLAFEEGANDGSNNLADLIFTIDFANYTGGGGSISLIDWGTNNSVDNTSQALLNSSTQNFNNAAGYENFTLNWDAANTAISLSFTQAAPVPEPGTAAIFILLAVTGLGESVGIDDLNHRQR